MITVGVDLAAEAVNTAVAILDWTSAGCTVTKIVERADDGDILDAATGAAKVGIDCPLGWPDAFVDFVVEHRAGNITPRDGLTGKDWRRTLANRLTDTVVHDEFGLTPLSVSTDRIAHPAMRIAALLPRLARGEEPLDRSGTGLVVEAYPAASLKRWGLPHRGYKGKDRTTHLRAIADGLCVAAPWLDLGTSAETCRQSDHALDAVVAGLTARAAMLGLTLEPTESQRQQARREGWIAVPDPDLTRLNPAQE